MLGLTLVPAQGELYEYRTWTQAVCDGHNYCEDYLFTVDGESVSFAPTGFAIQHELNWTDPRF